MSEWVNEQASMRTAGAFTNAESEHNRAEQTCQLRTMLINQAVLLLPQALQHFRRAFQELQHARHDASRSFMTSKHLSNYLVLKSFICQLQVPESRPYAVVVLTLFVACSKLTGRCSTAVDDHFGFVTHYMHPCFHARMSDE